MLSILPSQEYAIVQRILSNVTKQKRNETDEQFEERMLWLQTGTTLFIKGLMLAGEEGITLEEATESLETHPRFDRRALGAIPGRLKREGLICKVDGYGVSKRKGCHAGIRNMWRLVDARCNL